MWAALRFKTQEARYRNSVMQRRLALDFQDVSDLLPTATSHAMNTSKVVLQRMDDAQILTSEHDICLELARVLLQLRLQAVGVFN